MSLAGSTAQRKGRRVTFELDGAKEKDGKEEESGEKEETFSDIDDEEMDHYLHTQEEADLKEVIWCAMNKEYLEVRSRANPAYEISARAEVY